MREVDPEIDMASGTVYMPSGVPSHTLRRRKLHKVTQRWLFDPQVYLSSLQPLQCANACANLVSYPWFANDAPANYDSGQQKQGEWKAAAKKSIAKTWTPPTENAAIRSKAIGSAIALQHDIGCEAIILPSPLTANPSGDYSTELDWLDQGMADAAQLAPFYPAFATIAISDTCLAGIAPAKNELLKTIVDAVTAREVEGVYLVLEQSNGTGYSCANGNTVGSVLQLVTSLKGGGVERLIVSFCGVLGLAAACLGADTWVSGWRRSERRLRLADMIDTTAIANSAYYSHQLAAEINVKNDLVRIYEAGLLDALVDHTSIAAPLIASIKSTKKIPPNWDGQNTKSARRHFLASVIRETKAIANASSSQRLAYGKGWLTKAATFADELREAFPDRHERTELNHQRSWLDAFETASKELSP